MAKGGLVGTPIDKTPVGNDCINCWGLGKTFGDVSTPGILTVTLSGILTGDLWGPSFPESPNGSFELCQILPCTWQYNVSPYLITVVFGSDFTQVSAVVESLYIGFTSLNNPACVLEVDNELDSPIGTEYYGGNAVIMLGI
jgi:hypothetical protein